MKRLFLLVLLLAGMTTAASCSRKVIARINGDEITQDQFVKELEESPLAMRVLENMLVSRIVEQDAKKKGVEVTDADVAQAMKKQKESMGARWDEYLKSNGMTEADIEKVVRQQLLLMKLFVTEDEARKYFDEHRQMFDTPAKVRFRKMVLATKPEAEQIRKEILDGKAKFDEVAREKSLDQISARTGGELGPVPVSAYVQAQPQLKDVLEKQPLVAAGATPKPDELSEAVPNNNPEGSYQIVEVLERQPEVKAKYEDRRFEAYSAAFQSRLPEISQAMDEMRANATLEIMDPRFNNILQQWKELKERKPTPLPEAGPSAQPKPAPPKQGEQPKAGAAGQPNQKPSESKPAAPK